MTRRVLALRQTGEQVQEFAARMGVHWTTASRWKSGKHPVSSDVVLRLVQAGLLAPPRVEYPPESLPILSVHPALLVREDADRVAESAERYEAGAADAGRSRYVYVVKPGEESMYPLILPGDRLLMDRALPASAGKPALGKLAGKVVAAVVQGAGVLCRLRFEGVEAVLAFENPRYPPIRTPRSELRVLAVALRIVGREL